MRPSEDVLRQIQSEAPPNQTCFDESVRSRLTELTAELLDARPTSREELEYYLGIRDRTISFPDSRVQANLAGATIVVTGGSGCVGTELLRQLRLFAPARLISAAITDPVHPVPGVQYLHLDVRRAGDLDQFFRQHRPDIVFHLAAQRDPGLAEKQVTYTACTNVVGTSNVVAAAERTGVRRIVHASTGKALRPYTADVYASSKRVGEWVLARAAERGRVACSAARFTHVVDNSIIFDRLVRWCHDRDVVRLHSADTVFYAQSALESAHLLLVASLAPDDGVFRLHMIRDLGWPVSLLALALGVMLREGTVAPLYMAGYDPGYEERPYPGLYDPAVAGDVSPLMNVMEAGAVQEAASAAVDAVPVSPPEVPQIEACLRELTQLDGMDADTAVRQVLNEAAFELFVATAAAAPRPAVERIVRLAEAYRPTMRAEHIRIDDVFRRFCTVPSAVPSAVPSVA
jgi:intracellular sulfur oxidation DsrE/DsrF family protein